MDDGLPHYCVQAIVQTRDGYLWVGTKNGLARFDGVRFTPLDLNSAYSSITALYEGHDGSLWIGTDGEGLFRWKQQTLSHYSATDGLLSDAVRRLCETPDHTLWIGTGNGLNTFRNEKLQSFPDSEAWAHSTIPALFVDEDGTLWIGNTRLLTRYKDGVATDYPFPAGDLRSIFRDRAGTVWIGARNGLYQMKEGNFVRHTIKGGLSSSVVTTLYEDRIGNFWVGTFDGLTRMIDMFRSPTEKRTRTGSSALHFQTELNSEGGSYDRVFSFCEDREGTVWVGAETGLYQLTRQQFQTFGKRAGLLLNNVTSVLHDKADTIWMGTWGGGLHRMQGGGIGIFPSDKGQSFGFVQALYESRDGSIWVGLDLNPRLGRWKDGRWTYYGKSEGLEHPRVSSIFEDSRGNLWLGANTGLNLFQNETFTSFTTTNGLAGNAVQDICETSDGDVWFATSAGLSRWRNGRFATLAEKDGLSCPLVLSLYPDREGTLWIGTKGGGLNAYRHGKFSAFTTKDGLFCDVIHGITEDNRGNLWFSSSKGIFRVNKRQLLNATDAQEKSITSFAYGKSDGIVGGEFNGGAQPAITKDGEGRIWFATIKGAVVTDPNEIATNQVVPPVTIEEILADKKIQRSVERRGDREMQFRIQPGRGELEFHYVALSLRAPEKNRFKYKLTGVDPDWVDADARRVAYYNNIKPGDYEFQVIACNNDGVWNLEGARATLRLLPHFWQATWFAGLAILAAVGVVGGGARYVTRKRLQRKFLRLEQQHLVEKERTRIAQDLHDELGARLTEILLLSDHAQKTEKRFEQVADNAAISDRTSEIARGMDAIVWAVNPQNDSFDNLSTYLGNYAVRFLSKSSIRCRLQIPDNPPSCVLSSEIRHSLFLVVKEALNNTVKHAVATEVRLGFQADGSLLSISIEDNGKGFSLTEQATLGNGLRNMEQRINKMGGRFICQSTPDRGTIIQLEVPIKTPNPP